MDPEYHPHAHVAVPRIDLSLEDERKRLSPSALKAFFNTVTRWKLRDEESRALLGGIPASTYYDYKKNTKRVLDQDKLVRISYLIGIYKALGILHAATLAERWVTLINNGPIFQGLTPVQYMVRGGIPAMDTVRRLLDARRGGM